MADYKQYITQDRDNGSVMISEDVIASIAEHAISEVEGIVGIVGKPGADFADLISKKNWGKGLKILISEDNTVEIDCNIDVAYGHSVVDTAQSAQSAMISAVESMTGVKVKSVNINVCGIGRN